MSGCGEGYGGRGCGKVHEEVREEAGGDRGVGKCVGVLGR